jgi:diguanylate cyclase (GGDEF)-like protein
MSILIVDDSEQQRRILKHILSGAGLDETLLASSAAEAMRALETAASDGGTGVDLVLMDIIMPEVDGIAACKLLGASEVFRDIPIMMVTSSADLEKLDLAFEAGAMDYIVKPVRKVELLARARSLLKLKHEVDVRKARERELLSVTVQLRTANQVLQRLSVVDPLTGIPNRRHLDEYLTQEWFRAQRADRSLALLMVDIDHFKRFNDSYGHQGGDECLRQVAGALARQLRRRGDLVARYGGEEFAVVMPETDPEGATAFGETLRQAVLDLRIRHAGSGVADCVTISLGVAAHKPERGQEAKILLEAADRALYEAKNRGRNQVVRA